MHTYVSLSPTLLPTLARVLFLLYVGTCCYRTSASSPLSVDPDDEPLECIDPTPPPAFPTDETPSCSLLLLQYDFAHTVGSPPVSANYTPPDNCRWNRAVLEFSAACAGEQSDRIAAVWIDGVELLRTSTAKPTASGVFWKVRKDVTRYSSLLVPLGEQRGRRKPLLPRVLSVMLENAVDDVFTGVYHVNVTLDLYGRAANVRKLGELRSPALEAVGKLGLGLNSVTDGVSSEEQLEFFPAEWGNDSVEGGESGLLIEDAAYPNFITEQKKLKHLLGRPSDLIIPISNEKGGEKGGFWFRIDKESDVRTSKIRLPRNAYKAVLEVCVSFHGDDEFWYTNPPDSYNEQNNIPSKRGNWAFREIVATIDGLYAGSVVPFPIVFPGGVNPLFWAPVVAIKAFDLPTYDLDVTPFLGNLVNGMPHRFSLGVSYSIPFWLVNANLHLWLDPHLRAVPAMLVKHEAPPPFVSRNANNKFLDGRFQLEAGRQARFEGWARSSLGNFTTLLDMHFKYKSSVEYKYQGTIKDAYSQTKFTTDVRITESPNRFLARVINEAKYPIKILTTTGTLGDQANIRTNLSHILYEFTDVTLNQLRSQSSITDTQIAGGWVQAKDRTALAGSASTLQTYQRRDNGRCHTRKVSAKDGDILTDQTSTNCNMRKASPSMLM